MLFAPLPERHDDGEECLALRGQYVLAVGAAVRGGDGFEDSARDQGAQRAVRMFFATPRLRWNSPKRRLPSKASRTISSDHQSPIASTDRATGHALSSKRVLVTMRLAL